MTGSAASEREEPVERFKPTTGLFVGWAGVALAVLAVGYAAFAVHSSNGVRLALGAVFAGAVVWVTQLRPRVTAYPRYLLMRGTISDVAVPYARVDDVVMGQTFNVWADGRRYVCVGIGRSLGADARQRMRGHSQGGLGANRGVDPSGLSDAPAPKGPQSTYQAFVLSRVQDLVAAGRRQDRSAAEPVRRTYAVPELVVLVVSGVAFAVSLLVG